MGQQPSKSKEGKGGEATLPDRTAGDGIQSLPSFSKSDTKESSKSFRGAIRSKIPGSGSGKGDKTDSPRPSLSNIDTNGGIDKSDATSIKSTTSGRSGTSRSGRAVQSPLSPAPDGIFSDASPASPDGDLQPPPSPTQSASLGKGHQSVNKARQTGEVDHVSDEPPTGGLHPSSNQQPKESILLKKEGAINPRNPDTPKSPGGEDDVASSPAMGIGNLKSVDLDDMINRLLDAGYSSKATKAVCLKNAEITAICNAV